MNDKRWNVIILSSIELNASSFSWKKIDQDAFIENLYNAKLNIDWHL